MTLKDYYNNLPEMDAPKANFRRTLASECGVAPMTVFRWLAGDVIPDKLKREKVAEITGQPVNELFPDLNAREDEKN